MKDWETMKTTDEKTNSFKRTTPVKEKDKTPPDGSFLMVDKKMLREHGTDVAIFMSNLIDKYLYFKEHFPKYNGTFFLTQQQQTEHTKMSADVLRKCKGIAKMEGWIETRFKGRPPKEWYTINVEHPDIQLTLGKSKGLTLGKSKGLTLGKSNEYKDTIINKDNKYKELNTSYEVDENNNNNSFIEDNKNASIKKIKASQFDLFWKEYPRKVNKGFAKTAWDKLCRKKDAPDWKTIRRALHEQKKSGQWQTMKFISHPTTWLNKKGWLNDPKEMVSYDNNTKPKEVKETGTPDKIIENNLPKYYHKTFKRYYSEASELMENGHQELAKNMVELYHWVENNQGNKEYNKYMIAPGRVIETYTDWLDGQNWITDKSPQLYKSNGTVFRKFVKEYEDEVGLKK